MTWMPPESTPVHCVQLVEEFTPLLALVRDLRPARLLEIGSHAGGTLYHFLQCMQPGGQATAISMQANSYAAPWAGWAQAASVGLTVYDGDSTSAQALALMAANAPYDFAFIDGSHWWEYVSQDWANVRPLIRPGGVVAFHDITDHGCMPNERVDVPRLWAQIKAEGHRTTEFVALPGCYCGIGVVYL